MSRYLVAGARFRLDLTATVTATSNARTARTRIDLAPPPSTVSRDRRRQPLRESHGHRRRARRSRALQRQDVWDAEPVRAGAVPGPRWRGVGVLDALPSGSAGRAGTRRVGRSTEVPRQREDRSLRPALGRGSRPDYEGRRASENTRGSLTRCKIKRVSEVRGYGRPRHRLSRTRARRRENCIAGADKVGTSSPGAGLDGTPDPSSARSTTPACSGYQLDRSQLDRLAPLAEASARLSDTATAGSGPGSGLLVG